MYGLSALGLYLLLDTVGVPIPALVALAALLLLAWRRGGFLRLALCASNRRPLPPARRTRGSISRTS
jgi:hypothetical protein